MLRPDEAAAAAAGRRPGRATLAATVLSAPSVADAVAAFFIVNCPLAVATSPRPPLPFPPRPLLAFKWHSSGSHCAHYDGTLCRKMQIFER